MSPGKDPGSLQAKQRYLGGEADTAHPLLAFNGPWLSNKAPWAHRVPCLGKCSLRVVTIEEEMAFGS